MARLAPINAAVCTTCGSKKTKRVGFSKARRGSLWVCENKHVFVVPTLVFSGAPKKSP